MKLPDRTDRCPSLRTRVRRRLTLWLAAACLATLPLTSFAGVFVSITVAPPPLPVYAQPMIPGPGYMWTPGYWAYADGGYFWVPGTWVLAPYTGALWTPGYWGWSGGFYVFHGGYWGPHIGFYGGVNYGYGYTGVGYAGGYWNHGAFNYNRTVNNINVTKVTNVYNKTVINNTTINRVSYNGGNGGLTARPTTQDMLATRDRHMQPIAAQQQQVHMASQNQALRASVNHGVPAIAATPRPGAFSGHGVMMAHAASPAALRGMSAGPARPATMPANRMSNPMHAPAANLAAPRSASFVPRNRDMQPMQGNRASSYASSNGRPSSYTPSNSRPSNNMHAARPVDDYANRYPASPRPMPSYRQAPAYSHAQYARPQAHPQAQPHRAPPARHAEEHHGRGY